MECRVGKRMELDVELRVGSNGIGFLPKFVSDSELLAGRGQGESGFVHLEAPRVQLGRNDSLRKSDEHGESECESRDGLSQRSVESRITAGRKDSRGCDNHCPRIAGLR